VWRWYQRYGLYVQQELQYEFAEVFLEAHTYPPPVQFEQPVEHPNHGRFTSPYHWRDQYKHGNTAPAEALRAQLEGKTYRQAAIDNGYSPASFPKYMKRAARLLRDAYAA
jgi:hypothetical protein